MQNKDVFSLAAETRDSSGVYFSLIMVSFLRNKEFSLKMKVI